MPKNGDHEITKYPNICKRYFEPLKKWLYGCRIMLANGSRYHAHEFEDLQGARKAVAAIRARERDAKYGIAPKKTGPLLKDLVNQHLQGIKRRGERIRAERVFSTWLSVLPKHLEVTQVTAPSIKLFVEKRQSDGQAPSSINRELNIIASALHSASLYFPELEQWRCPKIPRPKIEKSRRERIITDNEYKKILAWLTRPPDEQDAGRLHDQKSAYNARLRVATIFRFAMSTGMRPKEIYSLKWADVDFTGKRIRVWGGKTGKYRYIPISQPVAAVLYELSGNLEKKEFIFTQGGNPTPKIYRILREAVEACGIEYGRKVEDGFELYCARHTFTTRLLQSGLDLRTVGSITGHSDREMVLHYSHITPESTARAVEALNAIEEGRKSFDIEK